MIARKTTSNLVELSAVLIDRLPSRRDSVLRAVAVIFVLAFALAADGQYLGFPSRISDGLIAQYASRFGGASKERLLALREFPRQQTAGAGAPETLLAAVNRFLNRTPFVSDQSHWGAEDYWATPAEMQASNGGDCEDYAISKYFLLKELGVPVSRLRITYVNALKLNQAHMVLAYYATPDAEPLILDNLDENVRPASQRNDLVPVYSFNDDQVWLAQKGRAGSSSQIRMWRLLIEKLEREART